MTELEKKLTAELEVERARVAQLSEALESIADRWKREHAWTFEADVAFIQEVTEAALSTSSDAWLREKLAWAAAEEARGWFAALRVEVPESGTTRLTAIAQHDAEVTAKARAATLEEAAKYVELNWTFDRPEGGYMRTPNGDRARRISAGLRSLSASGAPPEPVSDRVTRYGEELRAEGYSSTIVANPTKR